MAQYRIDTNQLIEGPRIEVVALYDKDGNIINGANPSGTAIDAFERLRVSQPFTLFDSQHRYLDNGRFSNHIVNGSVTHNANDSSINLQIGTASGDIIVRESKKLFTYQPGKSLLILITSAFNERKTNLRQRVGYFGHQNGIYLEQTAATELNLVLRSFTSGSVVERRIPQSSWNMDKCDGTDSEFNIDETKGNIFFIEIEWLGVGDVKCGFIYDGSFIVAHVFKNTNLFSTTYMTTACLPIRYEIENLGITSSNSTFKQICASINSEGGFETQGITSGRISRGEFSYHSLATSGVSYPTVSLRLNSNFLDSIVKLSSIDVLMNSNSNILFTILLNPTLTNANFIQLGRIDYDISATALTGGTVLGSGYLARTERVSFDVSGQGEFKYQLGRTVVDAARSIAGVSDIITLACTPFSNAAQIASGVNYEILI